MTTISFVRRHSLHVVHFEECEAVHMEAVWMMIRRGRIASLSPNSMAH
jgi:hypothetical protein